MISDLELKENIRKQSLKSANYRRMFESAAKWYEKAIVWIVVLVSTILPLRLALKLYLFSAGIISKNPKHRYARETLKATNDIINKSK